MNEKVDMKEGCARLSFLFVVTKWQDNNVIYIVYYVQILNLCMMGAKGVHIKAWNTGHDGSLGTAHANSTGDMISRVETMVLMGMELPLEAVRRQIASGVELLVHMERARDGKRQVAEIAEILGYEDGEVRMHGLYRREKDQLKKIGELQHREKLERCFGEAEL